MLVEIHDRLRRSTSAEEIENVSAYARRAAAIQIVRHEPHDRKMSQAHVDRLWQRYGDLWAGFTGVIENHWALAHWALSRCPAEASEDDRLRTRLLNLSFGRALRLARQIRWLWEHGSPDACGALARSLLELAVTAELLSTAPRKGLVSYDAWDLDSEARYASAREAELGALGIDEESAQWAEYEHWLRSELQNRQDAGEVATQRGDFGWAGPELARRGEVISDRCRITFHHVLAVSDLHWCRSLYYELNRPVHSGVGALKDLLLCAPNGVSGISISAQHHGFYTPVFTSLTALTHILACLLDATPLSNEDEHRAQVCLSALALSRDLTLDELRGRDSRQGEGGNPVGAPSTAT